MDSKTVTILNVDDRKWKDYIFDRPDVNVFHHPQWSINFYEVYGYKPYVFALINSEGAVVGGIPVSDVSSPFTGKRWVSLPYTDHCIPVLDDPASFETLADQIINLYQTRQIPKTELRWSFPKRKEIQREVSNVLHTQTCHDLDSAYKGIQKRMQEYIKTFSQRDVHIERDISIPFVKAFYEMHVATRRKHGIPVQPWRYFEGLQKNIFEKGMGSIILAFDGKHNCLAGSVILHWKNTLTIKYRASITDNQVLGKLRPNYQLDWEVIKIACDNNFGKIDFGRSDINQPGLRQYKKNWGFEEQELAYSLIGYPPRGGSGLGLRKIPEYVIRHSPLWVCRLSGELLYKHFA